MRPRIRVRRTSPALTPDFRLRTSNPPLCARRMPAGNSLITKFRSSPKRWRCWSSWPSNPRRFCPRRASGGVAGRLGDGRCPDARDLGAAQGVPRNPGIRHCQQESSSCAPNLDLIDFFSERPSREKRFRRLSRDREILDRYRYSGGILSVKGKARKTPSRGVPFRILGRFRTTDC